MLNCKYKNKNLTCSFPNWIVDHKSTSYTSRLAWCYGDLGVGIALLKAGKILKDDIVYQQAIDILSKTTKRQNLSEVGIEDAGLCHGAYGINLIYLNLYYETKKECFKNSANYWANIGINLAIHEDGYAGYKSLYNSSWKSDSSFLEGISGIGLTIISNLSDKRLIWNKSLLIS